MKISKVIALATDGKYSGFQPVVIELHERSGGQKFNFYFTQDSEITLYQVRDCPVTGKDKPATMQEPIVRVMNRTKAYFIKESLEDLYKKLFPAIKVYHENKV
jgi:hypothetical protein